MSTKLFVGNVSYELTADDLQNAFSQFGRVHNVNLIMDTATGKSKGFAFVTMGCKEDTKKAIQAMNGKPLAGRRLAVDEAKPKTQRSNPERHAYVDRSRYTGMFDPRHQPFSLR